MTPTWTVLLNIFWSFCLWILLYVTTSIAPTKFLFEEFLETVIYEQNASHPKQEEKEGKALWP